MGAVKILQRVAVPIQPAPRVAASVPGKPVGLLAGEEIKLDRDIDGLPLLIREGEGNGKRPRVFPVNFGERRLINWADGVLTDFRAD